ncbi:MAG: hypothetical protein Ct9H90mP19_1520 [Gammaproteobacteria bacterium]|nr:MAG: hypothetical protein Ct9H90mP19_1520 [Gammaproteobacteria bacterium]
MARKNLSDKNSKTVCVATHAPNEPNALIIPKYFLPSL